MKGFNELIVIGAVIIGFGLALRYGKSSIGLLGTAGQTAVKETQALTLAGSGGNPGYYGP